MKRALPASLVLLLAASNASAHDERAIDGSVSMKSAAGGWRHVNFDHFEGSSNWSLEPEPPTRPRDQKSGR